MHLVIPFAAALLGAPAGPGEPASALDGLPLPRLAELLGLLEPLERDEGDEYSLTTPHERVLARALGLVGDDGRLPWAAVAAQRDGLDTGDLAWGLLSPAHWRLGTEQLSLLDPDSLQLDETESRAFLAAVRELFESEGFVVAWGAPTRWYVAHASLADLPTASLDRVIGRNVDRWLDPHPSARLVRRLQSEVQMVLQDHPLNAAREARGQPALNSFWLSGCGLAPAVAWPADLVVEDRLRRPALDGDVAAWRQAWSAVDAGPVADLLQAARRGERPVLSLAGERAAVTAAAPPRGWLQRLAAGLSRQDPRALLEAL